MIISSNILRGSGGNGATVANCATVQFRVR